MTVLAWRSYEAEPDYIPWDGYYYAPIEVWAKQILDEVERRRRAKEPQLYLLPTRLAFDTVSRETSDMPALKLLPGGPRPVDQARRTAMRQLVARGVFAVENILERLEPDERLELIGQLGRILEDCR